MSKDELATRLIKNSAKLKTDRANYDDVYQEISEYVTPNRGDFLKTTTPGERTSKYIFDGTAPLAHETLSSVLHSGLTDPSSRWFNLTVQRRELRDNEVLKRWVEEAQDHLFDVFSRAETGFSQHNHEYMSDLVAYGTAAMWVSEDPGNGIIFQTRHLGEIYIQENSKGFVDTVYREFEMEVRQSVQEFGEDVMSKEDRLDLKKDPHKKKKFVHAVLPFVDFERMGGDTKKLIKNRPFVSVYVCVKNKQIIKQTSFHEMPYIVARWDKKTGEVYGRSPAYTAMPDIQMVNAMREARIRSAQKQIDPPLLISDDGVMLPMDTSPGSVIIGAVNDEGKELVRPLITNARVDIAENDISQAQNDIRAAFYVDQFLPREGVQPLTATEVQDNQQNRIRLIGPQTRRIEDEYLSMLINRVFAIEVRAGRMPDLPQEVQNLGVDALDLGIEYISPLSFNRKSAQLLSYNRFFSSVGVIIESDPSTMDILKKDEIVREAAVKSGVPLKELNTTEEVGQIRQDRAEAQQQAQLNEALASGQVTDRIVSELKNAQEIQDIVGTVGG